MGATRRRLVGFFGLFALMAASVGVDAASAQARPTCFGQTATIVGTEGSDSLVGTSGADVIVGLGGNDTIRGRGGDDLICGGQGDDDLYGGRGADKLDGGEGNDSLSGNDGDDVLKGRNGDDRLVGDDRDPRQRGRDRLLGGWGNDWMFGGLGADFLSGGPGSDALYGEMGADVLVGAGGADRLVGMDGNDRLSGGAGTDVILGGVGEDQIRGGGSIDTCDQEANEPVDGCEQVNPLSFRQVQINPIGTGTDPTGSNFTKPYFEGVFAYASSSRTGDFPTSSVFLKSGAPFMIWVPTADSMVKADKDFSLNGTKLARGVTDVPRTAPGPFTMNIDCCAVPPPPTLNSYE